MRPRTLALVAATLVAAVAAIWLALDGGGAPPASAALSALATPPAPDAVAPQPPATPAIEPVADPAPAPIPASVLRRRPVAPAATAWADVPIGGKPADLGPGLAGPLLRALDAARDQMDTCFQEEARLLASGSGPQFDPADPPSGPAILVLQLESRQGALDVVDTEVESLGTSTKQLVACCRHVLRGWPVPAPAAEAGKRYRMRHILR